MTQKEKIEPNLDALERAVSLPQSKSFAPPTERGIHELLEEVQEAVQLASDRLQGIKKRLAEFDRLQSSFYNGRT